MRGDIHRFEQLVSFLKRLTADERYKSNSNKKSATVMSYNDGDNIRWILTTYCRPEHVDGIPGRAKVGHIDTLPDRRGQY